MKACIWVDMSLDNRNTSFLFLEGAVGVLGVFGFYLIETSKKKSLKTFSGPRDHHASPDQEGTNNKTKNFCLFPLLLFFLSFFFFLSVKPPLSSLSPFFFFFLSQRTFCFHHRILTVLVTQDISFYFFVAFANGSVAFCLYEGRAG